MPHDRISSAFRLRGGDNGPGHRAELRHPDDATRPHPAAPAPPPTPLPHPPAPTSPPRGGQRTLPSPRHPASTPVSSASLPVGVFFREAEKAGQLLAEEEEERLLDCGCKCVIFVKK